MSWQWVTVLAIVVLAWTVHRVTAMWQTVAYYRYSSDEVKQQVWLEFQKTMIKDD